MNQIVSRGGAALGVWPFFCLAPRALFGPAPPPDVKVPTGGPASPGISQLMGYSLSSGGSPGGHRFSPALSDRGAGTSMPSPSAFVDVSLIAAAAFPLNRSVGSVARARTTRRRSADATC